MKSVTKGALAAGGGIGLPILIVALLVSVIAMGAIFAYVAMHDGYDTEYVALLSEQRVLSQRMTTYASQSGQGEEKFFALLKSSRDQFTRALRLLRGGNPETGRIPSPPEVASSLEVVVKLWDSHDENLDTILSSQELVLSLRGLVEAVNDKGQELLELSDEIASILAEQGGSSRQMYFASRQMLFSERIASNVNLVFEDEDTVILAADQFAQDADQFGEVIDGLLRGNRSEGIERVSNSAIRSKLRNLKSSYAEISEQIGSIMELITEMFPVSGAVGDILDANEPLLRGLSDLEYAYQNYIDNRLVSATMGSIFGLVAFVMLILLALQLRRAGYMRLRDAETQRTMIEAQNKRNQNAIMRLLDEMGDLADGDLTVNATVTEDVTGAIADSMNYAIDALRSLVIAINETVAQVSTAAQQSQARAMQLAQSSTQQAEEIASASTAVTDMAVSIEGVSTHADELADEAQRSVEIAKQGAEAVRKTIHGMDTIREQIQETSKRIKRLGESSQEIGDIVELINDIAEQTNILALNAAIQAAMAGEAGRGFAVVADEVQRLAERSGDATKQIEALVKTIQADTGEAVLSMEQSTSGVVAGAKLAEDAGASLSKIEEGASSLADLIQSISDATHQQAGAASNISDTMNVIQEITTQTSEGTNQTALSIGNLANLANDLKKSVAGFKLPE
ncbi:MAG: type IV pili methyl-accepting chemotaxis transducer N-terminal domain-containing protein [Gammaproteobacteria bacterium]|nr:type IV pili methyl-accepting chemotaxis transducer N-terminal domain-containing protein [Gammaproteobacteria bacterium]